MKSLIALVITASVFGFTASETAHCAGSTPYFALDDEKVLGPPEGCLLGDVNL